MHASTVSAPIRFPSALRLEVRRAARLSHSLAGLIDRVHPDDDCFVWLIGRHDEVRAFVGGVMREWSEGKLDAARASERIGTYARSLEESVQAFFHAGRPSIPPYRFRPQSDTLVDA